MARAAAIHLLAESRDERALPLMEAVIRDADLAIRVNAMRFVCAAKGCPDPLIEGWLASEDARVAAGAVVCALKDEGMSMRSRGEHVLMTLAAAEGPRGAAQRREAALALGWIDPASALHTSLIPLLRDADQTVAKAALRSAAQVQPMEALLTIISALLRNEIAGEAGDTLTYYGPSVLPALERAYADPQQPVELHRLLPRVVAAIGGPEAVAWLMNRLDEPDRVARYHLVKALDKLRARDGSLVFDPFHIERRLLIEIREHDRLLTMRQHPLPADSTPGSQLFKRALAERMADNLKLIFRLLGLLFPIKDIHAAYYGVISGEARVRDHAVEFLDSLLAETLKRSLIPLIDRRASAKGPAAKADLAPSGQSTLIDMFTAVVTGSDPWLASCALYAAGEQKLAVPEKFVREALEASDSLVRETAVVAWRRLTESAVPM